MALKAFTYPLPETRFIHAGRTVYKLKMRYSHHIREDLGINREQVGQELEDSIRAVLGNLDNLQPFSTAQFTIFPYKNKWERLSELRFKQGNKVLISYPYVCTLYIELRSDRQHLYADRFKIIAQRLGRNEFLLNHVYDLECTACINVKEESSFTDCGFAEELRGEAAATEAQGAKEKETERSQLQPNRKRTRSAVDINNKENRSDSNTASRKKRKKQVKRPDRVDTARDKQASSGDSGKPLGAAVFSNNKGVKEQTNFRKQPTPGSTETVAGGILRFLSSAFIPFHSIFGTKRSQ